MAELGCQYSTEGYLIYVLLLLLYYLHLCI